MRICDSPLLSSSFLSHMNKQARIVSCVKFISYYIIYYIEFNSQKKIKTLARKILRN